MDLEKLGGVAAQAIRHETVTPLDVVSPLDDQELMQAVRARGLLVGEAATGLAMNAAATDEVAVVEIPEIDPETEGRLEALNSDFREVVETRYEEKYLAVDGYIRRGILSEAYRLPPLGELMDRVEAVAPAYDAINQAMGNAGFDFAPQRLTDEQKSQLTADRALSNGQTTRSKDEGGGAYNYNAGYEVTDPTISITDATLWDTAVMDVSETPILRGISADGSKAIAGVDVHQTMDRLAAFRNKIGLPKLGKLKRGLGISADERLVCQVSPDEDTMFGIQLGRIERGEEMPLDSNGIWTIGKQNVKVGGAVRSVFSYFSPGDRRLYSFEDDRGYAFGSGVVRLSARGKDFVLKP